VHAVGNDELWYGATTCGYSDDRQSWCRLTSAPTSSITIDSTIARMGWLMGSLRDHWLGTTGRFRCLRGGPGRRRGEVKQLQAVDMSVSASLTPRDHAQALSSGLAPLALGLLRVVSFTTKHDLARLGGRGGGTTRGVRAQQAS